MRNISRETDGRELGGGLPPPHQNQRAFARSGVLVEWRGEPGPLGWSNGHGPGPGRRLPYE